MDLLKRIAVGTANWGQKYNGSQIDKEEIRDILDYCTCCGIDMLDTAEEYGSEEIVGRLANSSFDIVTKGNGNIESSLKSLERDQIYGYLWRTPVTFGGSHRMLQAEHTGLSLYDAPPEGSKWGMRPGIIQVPYSLMDRRFEHLISYWCKDQIEVHVRSIFLRGKCLEKATPQECIKFVLCNPFIDRVVMGIDSLAQLKENVEFIHKWNSMQCSDETIIDPRCWERKKL